MRELAFGRDRDHAPLTQDEKWARMLGAFSEFIEAERGADALQLAAVRAV